MGDGGAHVFETQEIRCPRCRRMSDGFVTFISENKAQWCCVYCEYKFHFKPNVFGGIEPSDIPPEFMGNFYAQSEDKGDG